MLLSNCQTTANLGVDHQQRKMTTRKPRIMFQSDEATKEALERWASDENRTVSSLIDTVLKELLIEKGYLEPPKKLLSRTSDRKT